MATGESLLHPRAVSSLMRHVTEREAEPLTERELEVLRLVAQGMANKNIARELIITERTVKFHVSAILGKLGVGNRTEAVRAAVQRGLISME